MKHTYTRIKQDPYEDEKSPRQTKPVPTENEYKVGTYTRYFVRHVNDHEIIYEIDKKQYDTLTKDKKGINSGIYEGKTILWRIRGKRHDEYKNGIRTYPGVKESNERLLEPVLKEWPTLSSILNDMTEHARIEIVQSSTTLTTNVENHFHYAYVDELGNGHTSEYSNPKNPNIKHYHEVRNWIVQESKDVCYPDCVALYGEPGKPPHTHEINQ